MNIVLAGPLCKLMWSLDFFSAGSRKHLPGLDYTGGFRDKARPLRGAGRGSAVKHTKDEQSSFRSDCIGREKSLKSWVSGGVSKSENPLEALPRGNADLEVSRDCVFTICYI